MEQMRAQAERFGAELVTDDVTAVDLSGQVKTVTDGAGKSYSARAVILAMGSAYRELGLPKEKELSGHGVSWCHPVTASSSATRTSPSLVAVDSVHRRGDLPDEVRQVRDDRAPP